MGHVVALVGGQYGSEGKGAIAAHMADLFGVHVRVGGPNAGHTYRIPDTLVQTKLERNPPDVENPQLLWAAPEYFVSQQLPVGWINPEATLVIGRGAVVDVAQLAAEVERASAYDPSVARRLLIDQGAWPIIKAADDEGGVNGELHQLIGSTGKGVGQSRMARLSRRRDINVTRDIVDHVRAFSTLDPATICDTRPWLQAIADDADMAILLEGTQGSALSLTHGPWPYVTSEDTNAAGLLVATGLPPGALSFTVLVVRTFPIRVAGNSGPLPLETSWEALSEATGGYIKAERTTVTKKVRRVAHYHPQVVREAVALNSPCVIALTFADYLDPSLADTTDLGVWMRSKAAVKFAHDLNQIAPVVMAGTGPHTMVDGWGAGDLDQMMAVARRRGVL